jgi:hypothetical protein
VGNRSPAWRLPVRHPGCQCPPPNRLAALGLSRWLNLDGTAKPSPAWGRAAAAHRNRAYLKRRDSELGIAARAAALRAAGGYEPEVALTPQQAKRNG